MCSTFGKIKGSVCSYWDDVTEDDAEYDDIEENDTKEDDIVNHPSHYCTGKFECIDVMIEVFGIEAVKCFCQCNAFKYLYRAGRKNGLEDMQKAKWYLSKYEELSKGSD